MLLFAVRRNYGLLSLLVICGIGALDGGERDVSLPFIPGLIPTIQNSTVVWKDTHADLPPSKSRMEHFLVLRLK